MKKILLIQATLLALSLSSAFAKTKEASDAPLATFCSLYWGDMTSDGSLCRFVQTHHLNRTHVGSGLLASQVPVITGDRLSVLASDQSVVVIGGAEHLGKSFVASADGYLSFRANPGRKLLSVRQVTVRRCFGLAGTSVEAVPCPE